MSWNSVARVQDAFFTVIYEKLLKAYHFKILSSSTSKTRVPLAGMMLP